MHDGGNSKLFSAVKRAGRFARSGAAQFKQNQDGSVDLSIQNESPGKDKEANWLPAPKGKFVLMLRLYWPDEPPQVSILDGSWKPPAIKISK